MLTPPSRRADVLGDSATLADDDPLRLAPVLPDTGEDLLTTALDEIEAVRIGMND